MADLTITFADIDEGKALVDRAVAAYITGVTVPLLLARMRTASTETIGSTTVARAMQSAGHAVQMMGAGLVESVGRMSESVSAARAGLRDADDVLAQAATP
ncbi:hypothetical protein ALI44B_14235 [Leifsonia sp. ALI-44-B]|jgi:hypothetical protein|uniref:hypothetical protein n=1 Tax=Leifsonia sp. ALI-44-B TaxID=1933776 RepID=UPI00097C67CD|nr:hypothetical protein [Leifsonia sp. ALI-44-B]ONI61552.1 hypothetical protein ALI44B_14235 [Leifsonia sp. ALI-44-B]